MRKLAQLVQAGICILTIGMACAQKANTRHPIPTSPMAGSCATPAVGTLNALPSSIPFTANNPGSEIAAGSTATVSWGLSCGKNGHNWTLSVAAMSTQFNGCSTVPESAISVKCVSATTTGNGQASAGCNLSSYATLPGTLPGVQLASGNEGNSASHNYTVVLSYQIADSWRYIANVCPLTVTYTVSAQ
jgi:hypothetical protein